MRSVRWVPALVFLLAAVLPSSSRGGDDCDCPCAHSEKAQKKVASAAPPASGAGRVASTPIAGGKSAAKPLPIDYERIYKINHRLEKGQKDYFSLPMEPGTELTMAVKSLKKSNVAVEILDTKDQPAATVALDGEVNRVKRVSWKPLKAGNYSIAVGGDPAGVEANQVIFEAVLAPAAIECAESGDNSIPIGDGAPREDCFWETDTKDTFVFEGRKNDVYRIEVVSPEASAALQARVAIDRKKGNGKVLADISGSGGRVAIESLALPEKGNYSLEVGIAQPAIDVLPKE